MIKTQFKRQAAPVRHKNNKRKNRGPQTAQQTIPYTEMLKDGICKVRDGFFTKTIAY